MRLERLVGDVLDLAKLDAHRFTVLQEEVDMEQLVERAYAAFGEVARRRAIDYRRELDAQPVIVTDGDRVLQIISNLLSNAFRWTPEGGRVGLELAAENGDDLRRGRRTRGRASAPRSASGSSGRSGRATAAAPGSASRSRASSRSRSAGGSSCAASRASARASSSCCRATARPL